MQRVIYFFVSVLLLFSTLVSAQKGQLMSYPEVHRAAISTIGVSTDGRNLISADVKGRIIFWDTEEKKPIRIWNIKGTPLKAKIIFENATAAIVYQTWGKAGEREINIQLLDLYDGKYIDVLDFDIAAPIKAFDFGPESNHTQQLTVMSGTNLVCIDLYKRKVQWKKTLDSLSRDVNYINEDILAVSNEGKLSFIKTKDGASSTDVPISLSGYKSDYVLNGYNIACFGNEVNLINLADGSKTVFELEDQIFKENIRSIHANKKYTIFSTLTGDVSSIGVYDNEQKQLLWYKPQPSRIIDLRIINQWDEIAFVNNARRLIVLSAVSGEVKKEIINVREDAKVVHLSPDFSQILYAHLGDGSDGVNDHTEFRRTSYWNMNQPSGLVDIDKGYFRNAIFTNNNNTALCLFNDSELSAINLSTLERKKLDIPDTNNLIRELYDFDFDEKKGHRKFGVRAARDGSNRLLLHSRAKGAFKPFEFNNADVETIFIKGKQVGIKKDGIDIYGDVFKITSLRSRINTQRNAFFIIDRETFKIETVIYQKPNVSKAELFADGRYIRFNYGAMNNNLGAALFDLEEGKFVSPDGAGDSRLLRVISDRSGSRIMFHYKNGDIYITSNKLKTKEKINIPGILTVLCFREKENSILYKQISSMSELKIQNYESNELPTIIRGLNFEQIYRDISDDGRFLSLSNLTAIQIIDLEKQKVIIQDANVFEPTSVFVKFSEDNQLAISSKYDGNMRIWNLEKEKLIATVTISSTGEWVVYTPEGLFDASPQAMKEMYYVVRKDIVDLSQVKTLYWQTDLLAKIIESKGEDLKNVSELTLLPMFPEVSLSTSELQDELFIHLKEGSGGIGWVSFYINGVEQAENINPEFKDTITVQLSDYADHLIPDRPNILSVVVFNASEDPSEPGWLQSKHKKIVVEYNQQKVVADGNDGSGKGLGDAIEEAEKSMLDPSKTRLIALIVGTSDYVGDDIDLDFADNDADTMALAIREVGVPFFGKDKVIVHKLTSTDKTGNVSSRENVLKKMKEIGNDARVDDIIFIFFSGHGISKGKKYYYFTKEASQASALTLDSGLDTCTISSDAIKTFIQGSQSLRKVLVFDACYSGAIQDAFVEGGKSISGSQKLSMDDLSGKTGMYILSSSSDKQQSFELNDLGQGILTYCMMEGFSGRAADNNKVDIMRLISHVTQSVPPLALQYERKQQPVMFTPEISSSFPLGRPNQNLAPKAGRKKIWPALLEERGKFEDKKELSEKFNQKIISLSKDKECPYMYVTKKFNDSIIIRGDYTVQDDMFSFSGRFIQNGIPLDIKFENLSETELLDQLEAKLRQFVNNL